MINTRVIFENEDGTNTMLSMVELANGVLIANFDPRTNPTTFSQIEPNVFAAQKAFDNAVNLTLARGWKKIYDGPPLFDFPEMKAAYK
jgi:hypothetical protein